MAEQKNSVFIATSIDGYISDRKGGLDWLHMIPNPEQTDMGYADFMNGIDAIVMGRNTFETVLSFDGTWPYNKPVFVLSRSRKEVPKTLEKKAFIMNGPLKEVTASINKKGFKRLYIDGGTTIQGFLNEDLIDELILTTIPILLGGGARLFSELPGELKFQMVHTTTFLNRVVQRHYVRDRS